ncbi:MAG: hemolysin family protein [archaeon]
MLLREQIYILLILLGLSAFFSAAETAVMGISRLKVLNLVDKNKQGARTLLKIKEDPHRYLTTILIGNNLVNVAASVLAASVALEYFQSYALGLATAVMTLLILVLGEITPKSLATAYKERFSLVVAKPIMFLSIVLSPVLWVFDYMHLMLVKNAPKRPIVTEDEIQTIINAGAREGEIENEEREMIQKVFRFDDLNVKDVMTPRTDMVLASAELSIRDLIKLVNKKPYSRIPVYEKSRDQIKGFVLTKDILRHTNHSAKVATIMHQIRFVPETQKLDTLLKQFQKRGDTMAVVIDEHGGVAGLVTIEDLLEEIVGEIVDEKDRLNPTIKKLGAKEWIVEGRTDIREVNDKLGSDFKEEGDFGTLGGFLLSNFGKIPAEGERITHGRYEFTIKKLDGKRIMEVRIKESP